MTGDKQVQPKVVRRLPVYTTVFILLLGLVSVEARELPDFTHLVEKNGAAVVNISTTQKNQTSHDAKTL
jgi:hypothetical protein